MTSPLPLTYEDLVLVDDMDPLALQTTSDIQNLEQDVMHILDEAPGSNLDDMTRGVGLDFWLGGTAAEFDSLASTIDTQLEKDPRIQSSTTTITKATNGNGGVSYMIAIQVEVSGAVLPLGYIYTPGSGTQVAA